MHSAASESQLLGKLGSLADATRARILLVLDESELTVSELCQVVRLPQSTVSRQLRILSREGWVSVRAEGPSRHYRLAPGLDPAARLLWEAVREDLARSPAATEDQARARHVREARAERSRGFFSSSAGRWDALREELFGSAADLRLLPALLAPGAVVGDLGCGTGRLTRMLAPFAAEVVAVDRSSEMLAVARERLDGFPNVVVKEGDVQELPMEDGTLDVAVLSLVLHYVIDPPRAIEEACRVLRRGGRVLILDMLRHDRANLREEMGHVWLGFDPEQVSAWLQLSGFDPPTWSTLPVDPGAAGPPLFGLRAIRA